MIDLTLKLWLRKRIHLDTRRIQTHLHHTAETTARTLAKTGLEPITFRSNKRFAELLTEKGLRVPKKLSPTTGKPTDALGQNDLAFIQLQAQHPELHALWDARRAAKSTLEASRAKRLLAIVALEGNQLRILLRYFAAHTGRFGGAEKINTQNFKRGSELRKSMCAGPGRLFFVRDQSQTEARIKVTLAGQTDVIDQFRRGEDVYSAMATKIYNRPIDRKRKVLVEGQLTYPEHQEGFVGKVCVLGLGYQMGAARFKDTLPPEPWAARACTCPNTATASSTPTGRPTTTSATSGNAANTSFKTWPLPAPTTPGTACASCTSGLF